jgi:hypothetical protein
MNKEFADRVAELMKENGYGAFGAMRNQMPVQQAQWPVTEPAVEPEQADEVPPGSQSTVVTNGETTPMGEPRTDVAVQNGTSLDSDTMGEVGSLLITIGHLLAKDKLVSDKFNTPEVLAFLSTNFKVVAVDTPPVDDVPAASVGAVAVVPPAGDVASAPVAVPPAMPMGADYLEQRKMFESKFKK